LCGVLRRGRGDHIMPPEVAAFDPVDFVLAALDDQHVLDSLLLALATLGERLVDGRLEGRDATLAGAAVGGDHELRTGAVVARASPPAPRGSTASRPRRGRPDRRPGPRARSRRA